MRGTMGFRWDRGAVREPGSLVAYSMEITNIDPMQNVLLFERFLNPERKQMPDIDVDFCQNRRGEVIDYVTQKYGRDQVAQIITFNTMAAKASIKDCGRAMDMPYGDVDRIAKLIPGTVGIKIDEALEQVAELRKAYEKDAQIRELIDTAKKLEGLVRGSGVHASAVVIAPRPLTELVPLAKTKNDEIVTAYDMKAIEKMGLLKMDFLGLDDADGDRRLPEADREATAGKRWTLKRFHRTTRRPSRRSFTRRLRRGFSSLSRAECGIFCGGTSRIRWKS
jgi:DNA polymerase III alpha subunit